VPRIIVTPGARLGLARCRRFLAGVNQAAAQRAGRTIRAHLTLLRTTPEMGRKFAEQEEWRELVIGFGDSGYVALYRYDRERDAVIILAFRHQKEAGY